MPDEKTIDAKLAGCETLCDMLAVGACEYQGKGKPRCLDGMKAWRKRDPDKMCRQCAAYWFAASRVPLTPLEALGWLCGQLPGSPGLAASQQMILDALNERARLLTEAESTEPTLSIEKIRQPLTAIIGRLDLVQQSFLTEDVESDLHAAREAAFILKRLCDDAEQVAKPR